MPTIGDDVTVNVGAIAIGDVTGGDGATSRPGALVANHVPDGITVLGVSARPVPMPRRGLRAISPPDALSSTDRPSTSRIDPGRGASCHHPDGHVYV